MDENQSNTSTNNGSNSKKWILIIVAVIVILAIAGGGFMFLNENKNPMEEIGETDSIEETQAISTPVPTETTTSTTSTPNTYKDGTYSATGTYSTPGGTELIGVKVTVVNGQITQASVTQMGKSPTAKDKQEEFATGFKPVVVGKALSSLNLDKVSGASLTTNGFNDALEQIRTQALS